MRDFQFPYVTEEPFTLHPCTSGLLIVFTRDDLRADRIEILVGYLFFLLVTNVHINNYYAGGLSRPR